MIDTLKHGALVFAYYPDREWLEESSYLQCGQTSAPQRRWPARSLTRLPAAPNGAALRPFRVRPHLRGCMPSIADMDLAPGTLERARAGEIDALEAIYRGFAPA